MTLASGSVRSWWEELARRAFADVRGDEHVELAYAGETSDFARFHGGRVRQAGLVEQHRVRLRLVHDGRQATSMIDLAGADVEDAHRVGAHLGRLRRLLPALPVDPWLLVARGEADSVVEARAPAVDPGDVLDLVASSQPDGADAVGVYASGTIRRAFASTTGQRNWHEVAATHLDWSLHRRDARDRAVKKELADGDFDAVAFRRKSDEAARELAVLARPMKRLEPGCYRAWLAPAAVDEWMTMLAWGGFGLQARRSRQSPLLRLAEGGEAFDERVSIEERFAGALAPAFQEEGFARPESVSLIERGRTADALVSPRSSREYGVPHNGATDAESPEALAMAGGSLATADVARDLGTGLYVGNLWYLNFSDRMACRATGMTRFGTFWVERGEVVAPVGAMRFDESAYRLLGSNLVAIGADVEMRPDGSTYGGRSTTCRRLPGVLVDGYPLTL